MLIEIGGGLSSYIIAKLLPGMSGLLVLGIVGALVKIPISNNIRVGMVPKKGLVHFFINAGHLGLIGVIICIAIIGHICQFIIRLFVEPLYRSYNFIEHNVLRFLLWRNGFAPFRYVRFLNHAAELLFLRRVGGGYIFVHRMVLEHFAELDMPDLTKSEKQ